LGELDTLKTRAILEDALLPMLEKNIDTVVLGCTHYPFVIPVVEQIVGENVRVIDPAPSVARQAKRLLEAGGLLNSSDAKGRIQIYTSGDVKVVESVLPKLLNEAASVKYVTWKNDREIL
jgi:glutamate racemase